MDRPTLQRVAATFREDGSVEVAISYLHSDEQQLTPGTKRRTVRAARMAAAGLCAALAELDRGEPLWGGFGTNTRESTDRVLVERKEQAS
jgi:hypothetical protein